MRKRKGITYNNEAPSYENNFNFDQPLLERPDRKVLSYSIRYSKGIALGFGEYFSEDEDQTKSIRKGDVLSDEKERARLKAEQRELFEKMTIWNQKVKL